MRRGGFLVRTLRNEHGGILAWFAIALPIILLFASFVVDVANWWEHKSHLQMQADAAALAGANVFSVPCDSTTIANEIHKYAGITGSDYNKKLGSEEASAERLDRLHMAVNSKTYPLQDTPVDTTVLEGDPCETGMVDVKLTETDVPWFFDIAPTLGFDGAKFVNARARATIVKVDTMGGALPIGVPDINPKKAKVQIYDEDDPTRILGEASLTRIGTFNGYAKWDNASLPIPLQVPAGVKHVGTRVILSGGPSLTCGQPLVDCYDSGSTNGLLHIHGWTSTPGGTAPVIKSSGLRANNCAEAYFTYSDTTCNTGVSAVVDFGVADPSTVGAKVTAAVGNKNYNLTFANGRWETGATQLIPVAGKSGPVPIELKWEQTSGTRGGQTCSNAGSNPCKGTFGIVQRAFSGTDARSGPLRIVKLYDSGLPVNDLSMEQCATGQDPATCTHNVTVEIGLLGSLQDADTIDAPLVGLRVVGGSQNQSLDCDPAAPQLKDELANSCGPTYTVNQGTACPGSINDLWSTPQPWPCVAVQTGSSIGQVSAGMNQRILGNDKPTTCTAPNHWSDAFPHFDPGDPRIVQVFLTPYGSFSGSGSTTVPVTNFATFYVTGWTSNGGFNNPCLGQGDEIEGSGEHGYIYGRFIKYIQTLPSGGGSEKCDLDSFGACTSALTE